MSRLQSVIPAERIERSILLIRGLKVMLDQDLAELYGVENKYLTRQVRRNIDRFPPDFMFQLTKQEFRDLRRQIGTSKGEGKQAKGIGLQPCDPDPPEDWPLDRESHDQLAVFRRVPTSTVKNGIIA